MILQYMHALTRLVLPSSTAVHLMMDDSQGSLGLCFRQEKERNAFVVNLFYFLLYLPD